MISRRSAFESSSPVLLQRSIQIMYSKTPKLATSFKNDGHISHQAAQKLRYDAFFDYKMRLFWYFCRQYESMIERDPAAKIYFSKVAQATVLRVINDLASVGNEPIGFVELTDEMQGTAGACKNSRHDKCTRLAKTTNDGNVFETRPHISDCPTVEQKPAY